MLTATGSYTTENASKYLVQLCKHFAHKIDVEYSDTSGSCSFPMGTATMQADGKKLLVNIKVSDEEALKQVQHVIDIHLVKFAFRENFQNMEWSV